ncbi:MAG: DUF4363 family protein [Ruminococcus sp.]|nr:DUF4363 family protein [Ruminococcus sp.]
MTRVKISAGILILVVVTGVISHFWIRHQCGELTRQAQTALEYLDEDNFPAARQLMAEMAEDWSSLRKKAGIFVRENKLLEADRVCVRMIKLKDDDSGEAEAELSELTKLLANIY